MSISLRLPRVRKRPWRRTLDAAKDDAWHNYQHLKAEHGLDNPRVTQALFDWMKLEGGPCE
jgi:hypothetical protein